MSIPGFKPWSCLEHLVLLSVLCLCGVILLPAEQSPAVSQADSSAAPSATRGSEIFQKRCISCHNKAKDDNSPFGPPNLYSAFRGRPLLTAPQAETIIIQGRGQMPAFGSVLSRTDIRSVIAYLRTH